MIVLVVPADVRDADPPHEPSQAIRRERTEDQMPVVGHQTPGEQLDGVTAKPLGQHAGKGCEVGVLVEQVLLAVAAIEDVVVTAGLTVREVRGM